MLFRRCGRSGLKLPAVSLGLWHNFGGVDAYETGKKTVLAAFDNGVTHFDLANNYGPPPGSAEQNFGKILKQDLHAHRDELIISTKAGYTMWPGPYGDWGSRKYLTASLDQSLKRMGLDYVDIFYHHRPDPETPLEETMSALASAVHCGKAIYAGISNYNPAQTLEASRTLKALGVPCTIHQPSYSMFNRWIEDGLLALLEKEGIGCIPFSPLAQGLLSDRYLNGIPEGSRASKPHGFLRPSGVTDERIAKARKLNELAVKRGQTLAQMAIAWILRHKAVTSVLVGASSPEQILQNIRSIEKTEISDAELKAVESILNS